MDTNAQKFSPDKNAAPPPATPPLFAHRESHVAGRLGISRDVVRALRDKHLTQGVHWDYIAKKVQLTDEAVAILAQTHRISLTSIPPAETPAAPPLHTAAHPAGKKPLLLGPPGDAAGLVAMKHSVTLKAWRSPEGNTHILEAYLPGTNPMKRENIVRVRVKSNLNFVRHMELPARLVQVPDLYELTRPCPRDRGRW